VGSVVAARGGKRSLGAVGALCSVAAGALSVVADVLMDHQERGEESRLKCERWVLSRGDIVDKRVHEVAADMDAWGFVDTKIQVTAEVSDLVNNYAFGKMRSMEGQADMLRVVEAAWKQEDKSVATMLMLKSMAVAVYWTVPEAEVRALRYGVEGSNVGWTRQYNRLRDVAPHIPR